jgi:hypothetical protein
MTSDEVFSIMGSLEKHSEVDISDRGETLSRITLWKIERRFPGQMLAPYRLEKRAAFAILSVLC